MNDVIDNRTKLSVDQVCNIRKEYFAYIFGCSKLAKKYGCGRSTIRDIIQYRTWKKIK